MNDVNTIDAVTDHESRAMSDNGNQATIDDIHANEGAGQKALFALLDAQAKVLITIVTTIEGVQYAAEHNYMDSAQKLQALEPVPDIDSIYVAPGPLPDDKYGRPISSQTDQIEDMYVFDGMGTASFPAGTKIENVYSTIEANAPMVPDIINAKSDKIVEFQIAVREYTSLYYDTQTRVSFLALFAMAKEQGLVNRAAYIAQLFTWMNSIIAYSIQFGSAVNALGDAQAVVDKQWDFSGITIPTITLAAAIQIGN